VKENSPLYLASAFVSGLLFSVGLAVGGMTQPSKVVGFLDFFGDWDPSLTFVMGGAVAVHVVLFRVIMKRSSPLLALKFQVPTRNDLTPQLLGGAALFGIGWGMAGFCPGPAIVSLGSFTASSFAIVVGMYTGFVLYNLVFDAQRTAGLPNRAAPK
jgi:uncharacterized membrane protein YedE/YeeE